MTSAPLAPTPAGAGPTVVAADAPAGSRLHLWIKAAAAGTEAGVAVALDGRPVATLATGNADEFAFRAVDLAGGALTLSYDPVALRLSAAYLFDPATVATEGIRLLAAFDGNRAPDSPAGYHFRPPFGWMNDPNGLGRFGGRAHLFYQHYPHALRWNTMHWGHAVSDDLIRWRHQPVFLFPDAALSLRADGRGGAFSGSAIRGPGGEGIRVFYTEQVVERRPEEQIQLTAVSADGLMAGPPAVVVPERPPGLGLTLDFRDPYVVKGPDGRWKMVLGTRDETGAVVLLYDSADPDGAGGWRFRGILYRDDRYGVIAAECPCLVPVDGPADDPATRWVLVFGLLTSRDPATGRRNLSTAVVGGFDGSTFRPAFEQELDFGTDAYAFQAFVEDTGPEAGRAVGLAWLANWTDIVKTADFPTAMTLPRRLELRADGLATPPVAAAASLRRHRLADASLVDGRPVALPGGAAEILLTLSEPGAPLDVAIDCPGIDLGVAVDGEGLRIRYQPEGARPAPAYLARGARPGRLRIFLDAGSVEVFADDGRWTGTKRLKDLAVPTALRLVAPAGSVVDAEVWALGF